MEQLVHRTVSATSTAVFPAVEAYSRWPLTLKNNAIRSRMNKQRQHGAVDGALQAAWKDLHQRLLFADSLGLFAGL